MSGLKTEIYNKETGGSELKLESKTVITRSILKKPEFSPFRILTYIPMTMSSFILSETDCITKTLSLSLEILLAGSQ